MAPTVPRPSEHAEETATETTAAAPVPDRPAEAPPAASGGKGGPKRPRPKVEPAVDGTERLPVVDDVVAGDEKPAKPAGKPRGKQAPEPTGVTAEVADGRAEEGTDEAPEPGRGARLVALVRRRAVPLLAVAVVLLVAVAVFAGIQDARLRGTPAAQNTALVDVGTTAEVAGQLSDAVETVYSFDFARLDANEKAARDVITPEFAAEFDRLFGEVRVRAPQQQAVVSATVTHSAVKEISGDRAVLVAFVDQQATRAAPDAQSQQLAAAGRLTVTGEWVDGRWKVAAVTPL